MWPCRRFLTATDGDPDPTNAGTAGEAALWGGSSAVVGMAANPFGAHQVGRHKPAAMTCRQAAGHSAKGVSQPQSATLKSAIGELLPAAARPCLIPHDLVVREHLLNG